MRFTSASSSSYAVSSAIGRNDVAAGRARSEAGPFLSNGGEAVSSCVPDRFTRLRNPEGAPGGAHPGQTSA